MANLFFGDGPLYEVISRDFHREVVISLVGAFKPVEKY